MRFEKVGVRTVRMTLEGDFVVMIGEFNDSLTSASKDCHIWLMTTSACAGPRIEVPPSSKIGCTYPVYMECKNRLTGVDVKVFHSFNAPYVLNSGWRVYPVSSGCGVGGANWLFVNANEQAVLVTCETSLLPTHLYQPAFTIGPTTPVPTIDHLVCVANENEDIMFTTVSDVISQFGPKSTTAIACRDAVSAIAIILSFAHTAKTRVKVMSPALGDALRMVPNLFEWLPRELQLYVLKSIDFCSNQAPREYHILANLISDGRVTLEDSGQDDVRGDTISVTLANRGESNCVLVPEASPLELERFYSPTCSFSHFKNGTDSIVLNLNPQ